MILKKIIHWLLLIASIILIISGFGITKFQTIEKITFGWLNKSLAFQLHSWLAIPFIIILILHIFLVNHRKE